MSRLSRRDFLRLGMSSGSGLLLGVVFDSGEIRAASLFAEEGMFRPNVWIRIHDDNTVILTINETEMGQGVKTSLAMLIAEELEVDWQAIRLVQAEPGPDFPRLGTGGSTSIRDNWQLLRQAGATAREMLINAAARKWQTRRENCYAQDGEVIDRISKQRLDYGTLGKLAALQPVPERVALKPPRDWKIIGRAMPMIDGKQRITGQASYGIDFQMDEMVYATIVHSPVFGARAERIDDRQARKVRGYRKSLPISTGVAVIAGDTWSAMQAARAIRIDWSDSPWASLSDSSIREQYLAALEQPAGETLFQSGSDRFAAGGREISAVYTAPYQAHLTMEPMNCTVYLHDGICEIWASTQAPTGAAYWAKKMTISDFDRTLNKIRQKLGFEGDSRQIKIHPQLIGGGFGRRLKVDYIIEAIEIAKTVELPVKLVWSREEDIQHGFYRPMTAHKLTARLDAGGEPRSWKHHIVSSDKGRSVGGADDNIYGIPAVTITYTQKKNGVPTGSWRSVGHSHNVFVIESFIDELAAAGGRDPLQYRLDMLDYEPRCQAVLQKVASMSDWQGRREQNRHLGIAVMKGFGSFVAQVVEVVKKDHGFAVRRVYCAVDCGMVVNPDTVVAQMEGGIIFALTAALKSRVTIKNGRVVQSNFHDMPILDISETPELQVEIIDSKQAPGGIGEVGVPCLAPALANALYSLTGKRHRNLWFEEGNV